ncbi:polyheme membrane-associated cytochrome C [Maribius pontilimi]|uniref:Polyheme membrane-associated cytochrome C n=1 Tax=Palleronia pontilimi TaxID=1964209 RepID=A0A934IDM8_9RHOB|nr:cytochrome c3 family protein [Palleronia pontilimi]MBJ3763716.1 polyheme membrane-associated cytochrome C [Palleronia pontilimi]
MRVLIPMLALAALLIPRPDPLGASEMEDLARITAEWLASPHAERGAQAFTHWDADGAVPEECATCHSGPGFVDFLGADGTQAGVVDHPAPTGAPVDCVACHTGAAMALRTVTFPSGVSVPDWDDAAVCATCHQGRMSGDGVDAAVAGMGDDDVSPDLAFQNIHYRASAATMLGGVVRGGYQYAGKTYAGRFEHVRRFDTCTECHGPHSTAVTFDGCTDCHSGLTSPREIRTGRRDFDGDGDRAEGIHGEILTLYARLGEAIGAYGESVAGAPIVYAAERYPYFFADTDADGMADDDEAVFGNCYQSWTPRLLRAAYNYQLVGKDPGGYAHNPRYVLQLLFDSLQSLSAAIELDMSAYSRP